MVTRLRSRGDNSGRRHTSPNSTSSVSVARPGAIRCWTGPDGLPRPAVDSRVEAPAPALSCAGVRAVPADSRRTVVLLVAHLFHPLHCRAIAMFRDRNVRHDACGDAPCQCFCRPESHDISRSNLFDRLTPPLDAANAGRDDQNLTPRDGVPRRAGTGLERDRPPLVLRVERLEQHLHTNLTREVRRWPRPDRARSAARDDHRLGLHRARRTEPTAVSGAAKRIMSAFPR